MSPKAKQPETTNQEASSRLWRLATYSAAAGAAPLMAASADAAIVPFTLNENIALGSPDALVDVNNDGVTDLIADNREIAIYSGSWQVLLTDDSGSTDFPDGLKITTESYTVPGVGDFSYVTPQSSGQLIDGSGMYAYFANLSYGGLGPAVADLNAGPVLVGFELGINGQKHFGWVRVSVNLATAQYTLIDGAYQSAPGVPIEAGAVVPEPTSLGLLAAGAAGVGLYRRRREDAAA